MTAPEEESTFRTPEFALVVACVAWPRSPDWVSRTADLGARVQDWRRVVALIDRHRIAGLAANGLSEAGIVAPDEVRAVLSTRARADAIHELRCASETVRLVKQLRAAGLDPVVLKGVTIAVAAFGRLGLRYSMDIDLLVPQSRVAEASAVLMAEGYERTEPAPNASPAVMAARMKRYKDLVFVHARTGTVIELHWRLFQNPTLLPEARGGGTIAIPGVGEVPSLDPDLALLYLCLHGGEHAWARLKWLADLAAILSADTDQAARLYEQGRARGLGRMVGPGLALSHELFATPLPERLRSDLARDARLRWLVRSNRAALFGDEDGLELEDQKSATTRKNLGHYVASSNPVYWYREFVYDALDGAEGETLFRRLGRLAIKVGSTLTRRAA